MEILKDDILQLNFHIFIGSWAQFEEPFVNLETHLSPKHNSPEKKASKIILLNVCNFCLWKSEFLQFPACAVNQTPVTCRSRSSISLGAGVSDFTIDNEEKNFPNQFYSTIAHPHRSSGTSRFLPNFTINLLLIY